MSKNIILAVGSTGGHFFPGLRIALFLREKYGIDSIFLGLIKTDFQNILNQYGFSFVDLKIFYLKTNKILCRLNNIIAYYFSLLKATFKSFLILCRIRPKLVLGTGSFGSFPACISSYLLGIPLFLYEQNLIAGKANRMLIPFAKKIFIAFSGFHFNNKKIILTGNPVERIVPHLDRKTCYVKFGLNEDKKILLIFGGSQGAVSLNTWIINILPQIEDFKDWQIIHITGKTDYERVKEKYVNLKINSAVLPFLFPMDYAYTISDLAIARGGALSLSELSFWGVPSLILPYFLAKDNHQEYNALYFQEKGGAYLFKRTEIEANQMPEILKELLSDNGKLKRMSEKMKKIMPNNALEIIGEEIYKNISKNYQ